MDNTHTFTVVVIIKGNFKMTVADLVEKVIKASNKSIIKEFFVSHVVNIYEKQKNK